MAYEKKFLYLEKSIQQTLILCKNTLDKVLDENGISFIDFLAVHAIDDIKVLTKDVRKWANKAKKQKKIKYFGFCTHKNMDKCLKWRG